MVRTVSSKLLLLSLCLLSVDCHRGYKSASALEVDRRGPRDCAKACSDLGLQMSAFVLVEHMTSGCVCSPPWPAPAPNPGVGAAAGGYIVEEEARRQEEVRRQQQQQQMQQQQMQQQQQQQMPGAIPAR